jgi:hypothetical protein
VRQRLLYDISRSYNMAMQSPVFVLVFLLMSTMGAIISISNGVNQGVFRKLWRGA